jgi:hypothetical protein
MTRDVPLAAPRQRKTTVIIRGWASLSSELYLLCMSIDRPEENAFAIRQFPLSRRRVHTVLNRSAWLFRIRIVVRCSTSPTQVLLLLLVGRSSGAIPSPFDVAIQDGAQTDRQEEQEE